MFRTILLSMTLVLLLVGAAWAKDIEVVNGTSFSLHGMALSPSESKEWGEDFLADSVLKPGESITISIKGDPSGWDLAVVDDEKNQIEFKKLDFSKVHKVTLLSDGTANLE